MALQTFGVGAFAGGSVNAGAQLYFKGSVNVTDVSIAAITGGLTAGRSILPSVALNVGGAYTGAVINDDNVAVKVAASAFGTVGGSLLGAWGQNALKSGIIPVANLGYPRLAELLYTIANPVNVWLPPSFSEGSSELADRLAKPDPTTPVTKKPGQ